MATQSFWQLQLGLLAVENTWRQANNGLLVLDVGNAAFASIARNLQRELAGDLLPSVVEQVTHFFSESVGIRAKMTPKEVTYIIGREQQKAVDAASWKAAELFEGRNGTRQAVVDAANTGARTCITATDSSTQATLAEKPEVKRKRVRFDAVLSPSACSWCVTILSARQFKSSTAEVWRGAHKGCGCRLVPSV